MGNKHCCSDYSNKFQEVLPDYLTQSSLKQVSFKVLILGDEKTGKTSLVNRFSKDEFNEVLPATLGADFSVKNYKMGKERIKFCLWDVSVDSNLGDVINSHYTAVDAIILCFDVTSKKSFDSLGKKLDHIQKNTEKKPLIVVAGNKTDLDFQRKVKYAEALNWAESQGCMYIETSSKEDKNIHELFSNIANNLLGLQTTEVPFKTIANDVYLYILVLGDQNAGKSTLVSKYSKGVTNVQVQMKEQEERPVTKTIIHGTTYMTIEIIEVHDRKQVETFSRHVSSTLVGYMLLCDLTEEDSLDRLPFWANCVKDVDPKNASLLCVGTKRDMVDKKLHTFDTMNIWACHYNMDYFEVSAFTNTNVDLVFNFLTEKILSKS